MTSEDFTGWRTASYSDAHGNCVQVGWRTASHSDANTNCVQVAASGRLVGVRDTKEQERGQVLEFPAAAWLAFISTAKTRAFR
jgi:uncharacterized protein DUF397